MASILETDRYDSERNGSKVCKYCGAPVAQFRNSTAVGLCNRHEAVWMEDISIGLHIQNRLRDLIVKSKN
jgi:hypothetical protein